MKFSSVVIFIVFIATSVVSVASEREPITPIPDSISFNKDKAELGMRLFFDPILSKNNKVSCASCHILAIGGVDGLPISLKFDGLKGVLNTPTVFNSALSFVQFWGGRAYSLVEQVQMLVHDKSEMGLGWPQIMVKLKKDSYYSDRFSELYEEKITPGSVSGAIAEFERSLLTPNSRFDLFLKGDKSAITPVELSGYTLFKSYGCVSCHQGVLVGGNMFEKIGVVHDFYASKKNITKEDLGLFNLTGDEANRYEFKVPSLRNVELTAPYLHDGSVSTLEKMVAKMAYYQLNRKLTRSESFKIISFLKTLTGKHALLEAK